MDAVLELRDSLVDVVGSLINVIAALMNIILPWLPLLAWVAYWSLAVNWAKTFKVLKGGGWIGVLLMMFVSILVWGAVAPPIEGTHSLFGLQVSNFAGKFIYVTMLTCIALLCGSAQMSGTFGKLIDFSAAEDAGSDH